MSIKFTLESKEAKKRFSDMLDRMKNTKSVGNLIAEKALSDVDKHFRQSMGPNGKWPLWKRKIRISGGKWIWKTYNERPDGRGGNKLLMDTGLMRFSTRKWVGDDEVHLINNAKYAKYHDEGTKHMAQRKFFWLSAEAISKIRQIWMRYWLRG